MLIIRLTRKGKKNQPFFRVVVIDKRRSAKGGRPSEILGYVDPLTKNKSLKKERILYWISKGAQPSATVHNLLVSEKIIDAKKINVSKKSKKKVEVSAQASVLPATTPASATEAGVLEVVEKPTEKAPEPEKLLEPQKEEPKPELEKPVV